MDDLSLQILEHFTKAKPSRLLHMQDGFLDYNRDEIKKRIYALCELGYMKIAYGSRSGAVYLTTKAGRECLQRYQVLP